MKELMLWFMFLKFFSCVHPRPLVYSGVQYYRVSHKIIKNHVIGLFRLDFNDFPKSNFHKENSDESFFTCEKKL